MVCTIILFSILYNIIETKFIAHSRILSKQSNPLKIFSDNSPVLLGVPKKGKLSEQPSPNQSKIGGSPIWHDCHSAESYISKNPLSCGNCSQPLTFIIQVYAPTDVIPFLFFQLLKTNTFYAFIL